MKRALFVLMAFFMATFQSCDDGFQYVDIETDYGTMKVKLYNNTPKHRDNFIKLVNDGFYDYLLFHRVIKDFMIQGGDPDSRNAPTGKVLGQGGPGYQIDAEFTDARHFKGALAAARLGGAANPEKKSSGSQFYIVQGKPLPEPVLQQQIANKNITYSEEDLKRYQTEGGTPFLDNEYTVFGVVVEGLDVIDKIAALQTGNMDRPVEDIRMRVRLSKGPKK